MAGKANAPNWEAIRQEYIETDISMRALAEKHGVNDATLRTHATTEQWGEQRRKVKEKANTKIIQKAADTRASFAQRLDDVAGVYLGRLQEIAKGCKSPYQVEKAVQALERLYKIKGLDAAGQLAAQQAQGIVGGADSSEDSFIEALKGAGERAWAINDAPDNVEDSSDVDVV